MRQKTEQTEMPARDERKHNPKTSFPFNRIWTQSTLSVNHLMGLYDSPLRQGGLTWNHTLKRVRRDPSCIQANLPPSQHSPGRHPFQVHVGTQPLLWITEWQNSQGHQIFCWTVLIIIMGFLLTLCWSWSPCYIHLNYVFLPGSNLDIKKSFKWKVSQYRSRNKLASIIFSVPTVETILSPPPLFSKRQTVSLFYSVHKYYWTQHIYISALGIGNKA